MELNTILNIMAEYKLSADEILLIFLTLYARDEEGHPEFFLKWYTDCNGQPSLKQLFTSLKEKGVIKRNYNPDTYVPNEIEFNKVFLKKYYKQSGIMGKELFDNYEPFIQINGKTASLRNISKRFCTLEEFYFFYSSQIGHDPEKHKKIMEILSWARQNKLCKISIIEFVASHKWNEFEQMRKEGFTPDVATSYDVYKEVE